MMLRIYLIRHGRTEWNETRRLQGQEDTDLSEEGRRQALRLATYFQDETVDAVYSSDLKRALKTARTLASPHGLEVHVNPGLREIHMGRWQGYTWEEVGQKFPKEQKAWLQNPYSNGPEGGENLQQVGDRTWKAFHSITSQFEEGHIALVSHGLVIGSLLCRFLGRPLAHWKELCPGNTGIATIEVNDGEYVVVNHDQGFHL